MKYNISVSDYETGTLHIYHNVETDNPEEWVLGEFEDRSDTLEWFCFKDMEVTL